MVRQRAYRPRIRGSFSSRARDLFDSSVRAKLCDDERRLYFMNDLAQSDTGGGTVSFAIGREIAGIYGQKGKIQIGEV